MTPKIYAISFLKDVEKLYTSKDLEKVQDYISKSKDIMGYATNRAALRSCSDATSYSDFLINVACELTKEISVEILNSNFSHDSQLLRDISETKGAIQKPEYRRKPRLELAYQILEQSKLDAPIIALKALNNATNLNFNIKRCNPFDFGTSLIIKGMNDEGSELRLLSQKNLKNEIKKEMNTSPKADYRGPSNNV